MKATREPVYSLTHTLSHNFVIGPLSKYRPLGQTGRLYYCTHCKWSFLVCGRKVAALDGNGQAITGEESLRRFHTFAAGPCPVLETVSGSREPDTERTIASRFSVSRGSVGRAREVLDTGDEEPVATRRRRILRSKSPWRV